MANSPNLGIGYLEAAQSQKHVTTNEALLALDAIVQLGVQSRALSAPPGATPSDGQRWIVGASPTGLWNGKANYVAAWQDNAWRFYLPKAGWFAYVIDEDKIVSYSGSSWTVFVTGGGGGSFTVASQNEAQSGKDNTKGMTALRVREAIQSWSGHGRAVLNATTTTPPASPSNNARYLVPSGASGAWSSQANNIAMWDADATTPGWVYETPYEGFTVWNAATQTLTTYSAGAWTLSDALDPATQAEAEAGTSNVRSMTPLRTRQQLRKFVPARSNVLTKGLATPPGSPSTGARYIVAASATGAWSGQSGNIAEWTGSAWEYESPSEGWTVWVEDENVHYVYNGSNTWVTQQSMMGATLASQAQAEAATDNTTSMTPLRTRQSIQKFVPVRTNVLSKALTAPPGSPVSGARYIVAASATGAWSGQSGKIAEWSGSAWSYETPGEGWVVWVEDEDIPYAHNGTAWVTLSSIVAPALSSQAQAEAYTDNVTYLSPLRGRQLTAKLIPWRKNVLTKTLGAPPGGPVSGDRYLVATGGTGAWAAHDGDIAEWNGSAWTFDVKFEGMSVWVEDENKAYVYNSTAWEQYVTGSVSPFVVATQPEAEAGTDNTKGMTPLRGAQQISKLVPARPSVISSTVATPPGSPTTGDRYLVPSGATGAWAGQVNNIAYWTGAAWAFETAVEAWLLWSRDDDRLLGYTGSSWVQFTTGAGGSFVIATQVEAEGGSDNTKGMTPIRTRQSINFFVPSRKNVLSSTTTATPGSPVTGARYIVPASGVTGAWAGNEKKIAEWSGSAWQYETPVEGWVSWVESTDTLLVYNGSALWVTLASHLGVTAITLASQAEAEAANDNTKVMTPLRTKQTVRALVPSRKNVLSATTIAPPGSPALGDRYIVPTGATGVWSTHIGEIAEWDGSAWQYEVSSEGWLIWSEDTNILYVRDGTPAWTNFVTFVGAGASFTVASQAEAEAATDNTKGMTPLRVKQAHDKFNFFRKPALDKDLSAPPGSPADGARYIVGASPTGAWAGQAGKIATYLLSTTSWFFETPEEGWLIYLYDEDSYYFHNGSVWGLQLQISSQSQAETGTDNTTFMTPLRVKQSIDKWVYLQEPVHDHTLSTPPGSPSTGNRYIVGASPTGAWAGHANEIATWGGVSYTFEVPLSGYMAFSWQNNKLYAYNGSGWQLIPYDLGYTPLSKSGDTGTGDYTFVNTNASVPGLKARAQTAGNSVGIDFESGLVGATSTIKQYARLQVEKQGAWDGTAANQDGKVTLYVSQNGTLTEAIVINGDTLFAKFAAALGINADPDSNNRLYVKSPASTFDNLGSAGNGHQLKINRKDSAGAASTVFQTNYSGRAEVGMLPGSDNIFEFKGSADGSTFFSMFQLLLAEKEVRIPTGMFLSGGARLLNMLAVTATGGYVKSQSSVRRIIAWGIGGGGAGGGVAAPTAGNAASAGGGASGALFILQRDIATSEATSGSPMGVDIGAGGTCTAGENQGGTGGTTRLRVTVGGTIIAAADGGVGGQPMDQGNWGKAVNGGYGQNATGGNMNLTGNPGGVGIRFDGWNGVSGTGSPGFMAQGGPLGIIGNGDGGAGNSFGAGGSGGSVIQNGTTAQKGGSGKEGVLWIWEFE